MGLKLVWTAVAVAIMKQGKYMHFLDSFAEARLSKESAPLNFLLPLVEEVGVSGMLDRNTIRTIWCNSRNALINRLLGLLEVVMQLIIIHGGGVIV